MNIGLYNLEQRNIAIKLAMSFDNLAYKVNMDALRFGLIDGKEWKLRADKIDKEWEEKLESIYDRK